MHAGQAGQNAVWGSTGTVNSRAFIDATPFYGTNGNDICAVISYILTSVVNPNTPPPNGVVIDARGVPLTSACSQNPIPPPPSCNGNPCPIFSIVVLLPPGTITVSQTWTLPSNTRIVGEGSNLTALQVGSSGFQNAAMIQMGGTDPNNNQPYCLNAQGASSCVGVGIEHLRLDGGSGNGPLIGVDNAYSEELSYVNDVALTNLGGIGLRLRSSGLSGVSAVNSGPYSDIYYSGSGTCAKINGTYDTRGIHGLTCNMTGSSSAAVYVDGSNNSIEDVYIQGSVTDGILVGSVNSAQGNLLANVNGGGTSLTNLIHISSQAGNVSDLTILGATCAGCTNTIYDELTPPTLLTSASNANVGMYVIGEPVYSNGSASYYSFFTSSPSVPTWLVGSATPSGSCATGQLYSTTSSATYTLWACAASTTQGSGTWVHIM
jgi:hypothetical protein